jgi:hypothetical protein
LLWNKAFETENNKTLKELLQITQSIKLFRPKEI